MLAYHAVDSAHAFFREAIAQILLWTSMACLPGSVVLFVLAFRTKRHLPCLLFASVGGFVLTYFMWYFANLGATLSDFSGDVHYQSWLDFFPLGFGIALMVVAVRLSYAGSTRKT